MAHRERGAFLLAQPHTAAHTAAHTAMHTAIPVGVLLTPGLVMQADCSSVKTVHPEMVSGQCSP